MDLLTLRHVLIADDDPVSRHLLEVSLTNAGYVVTTTANGAEALRILESDGGPRLAILDWMMPEKDGVEVCAAVRQARREPYVYLILLTARGQQSEIVAGLEAGADDYITKPFDLHELKARLRSGRRILELQAQLVTARDQLQAQATHDGLTGLLNRPAILNVLQSELARFARKRTPVAVIMADFDHFKRINDTSGHLAGDQVLREACRRMKTAIRSYDSMGRYGGEELLIVAPGCGIPQAAEQAERLRKSVAASPIQLGGQEIAATISLGVAAATTELVRPEDLLRAADEALYAAKHAGRNRVESCSGVAT